MQKRSRKKEMGWFPNWRNVSDSKEKKKKKIVKSNRLRYYFRAFSHFFIQIY